MPGAAGTAGCGVSSLTWATLSCFGVALAALDIQRDVGASDRIGVAAGGLDGADCVHGLFLVLSFRLRYNETSNDAYQQTPMMRIQPCSDARQ